jgi:hypothetical protein
MDTPSSEQSPFLYRLFFTRNDDLDLLQVMYLGCVVFFFVAFGLVGSGVWKVPAIAWNMYKWVFGLLAITGVPTWAAAIIEKLVGVPTGDLGGGAENDAAVAAQTAKADADRAAAALLAAASQPVPPTQPDPNQPAGPV